MTHSIGAEPTMATSTVGGGGSSAHDALARSRGFWNEKAREPYWYISSFTDYRRPNVEAFWNSGATIWRELKGAARYLPSREHTVLEIGCGIGRLSRVISADVGALTSVDISPDMISRARAENPGLVFVTIDGVSLGPWDSNTFDLIVAYCVWQHLPSLSLFDQGLREALRVLRPGGRLIFTYDRRCWKDNFRLVIKARAWLREALRGGPKGLHREEWLGIRPTEPQVLAACQSAGFADTIAVTSDIPDLVVATKAVRA